MDPCKVPFLIAVQAGKQHGFGSKDSLRTTQSYTIAVIYTNTFGPN